MDLAADIPQSIYKAFPILSRGKFLRVLAAATPIIPDTTFNIFIINPQQFLTLVVTDYADPFTQSKELRNISGNNALEFTNLVKPHSTTGATIEIKEHDSMDGDFLIKEGGLYYYLANTHANA